MVIRPFGCYVGENKPGEGVAGAYLGSGVGLQCDYAMAEEVRVQSVPGLEKLDPWPGAADVS